MVVPLDFMRIPLIAVIGWWFYGEPLDVFVFLGAGLIMTGIYGTCAEKPRGDRPDETGAGENRLALW